MKTTISVRFRLLSVEEGLCPYISGSADLLGHWDLSKAMLMELNDAGQWAADVDLEANKSIEYGIVQAAPGVKLSGRYKGLKRAFRHLSREGCVFINEERSYYEDHEPDMAPAFSKNVCHHSKAKSVESHYPDIQRKLILRAFAPGLMSGTELCLIGDAPTLGEWQPEDALPMSFVGDSFWEICLDMDRLPAKIEYKFLARKPLIDGEGYLFTWDKNYNQSLRIDSLVTCNTYIYVGHTYDPDGEGTKRYAGTAIPLSAIRYKDDWGIGDFMGLRKMIDWVADTGQRVLQLLPIFDTTYTYSYKDAYPYNPISLYAINPVYIDINALPPLSNPSQEALLREQAVRLHLRDRIDYPAVQALKNDYLYRHFLDLKHRERHDRAFKRFVRDNDYWLLPYVSYCILRDRHIGLPPSEWGEYADYSEASARKLVETESNVDAANYYRYVQYLLDRQFLDVASYAEEKGVVLKGDLPVGVSPNSATVWARTDYYNRDVSIGAPPDSFAPDGQNWGFPPLYWDGKVEEDESCKHSRMARMARFFSAMRIDHVLGFFRIWTIPLEQYSGLLGQFFPAIGFTAEEIRAYGYPFDPEIDAQPMLDSSGLYSLFGVQVSNVVKDCLVRVAQTDLYTVKPHLANQRLVRNSPAKQLPGGAETKKALEHLITEQPFVRDHREADLYHPRYMFERSQRFKTMGSKSQAAWSALNYDYYYGRNDKVWFEVGKHKLEIILASSSMLVCVEDLGCIPPALPAILSTMPVLTLEIERMPKLYGSLYTDLGKLHYRCVCATSTHDMPPLRLWWEQMTQPERDVYAQQILGNEKGKPLPQTLTPTIAQKILTNHLSSPAMLAIFPLSDWLAATGEFAHIKPEEELINDPTNPDNRWDYRMPCNVEDLLDRYAASSKQISSLVNNSGRRI